MTNFLHSFDLKWLWISIKIKHGPCNNSDKFIVHKDFIFFIFWRFYQTDAANGAKRKPLGNNDILYLLFMRKEEIILSLVQEDAWESLHCFTNRMECVLKSCILTHDFCNCRASILHSTTHKTGMLEGFPVLWRRLSIQDMMTVSKSWVIWNMAIKCYLFLKPNKLQCFWSCVFLILMFSISKYNDEWKIFKSIRPSSNTLTM